MNLIKQAAEDWNKSDERDYTYTGSILHFLSYLSQQGDEEIVTSLVELRLSNFSLEDIIKQALAIGRASNRWIPVTERLPEEKDAVEIDSIKSVEILWRAENYWLSTLAEWSKMKNIGYVSHWRTPSQYPEPPKSDI